MAESFSLGDAEREFFLGIYRSAVDFYKPRIEQKTGVPLGCIAVWDYSQMPEHPFYCLRRRLIQAVRQLLCRRQSEGPDETKSVIDEWASQCSAAYYKNGIYISFKSGTAHEEAIAAVVVHELAHALWERLAAKPLTWRPKAQYREKYALFVEGFATYAERVWFLDLYPASIRASINRAYYDPKGIHFRGMRLIEHVVRNEGPQVLLEIPQRWTRLS